MGVRIPSIPPAAIIRSIRVVLEPVDGVYNCLMVPFSIGLARSWAFRGRRIHLLPTTQDPGRPEGDGSVEAWE